MFSFVGGHAPPCDSRRGARPYRPYPALPAIAGGSEDHVDAAVAAARAHHAFAEASERRGAAPRPDQRFKAQLGLVAALWMIVGSSSPTPVRFTRLDTG